MSPELGELALALGRLRKEGFRAGLAGDAAGAFVGALDRGTPLLEAAARAGLDRRLAAAVDRAGVRDLALGLSRTLLVAARLEAGRGRLRAAAAYPLALGATVLLLGAVIWGLALPAMAVLPGQVHGVVLARLAAASGISGGLLFALALVVFGRLRVPGLSSGWMLLERCAFCEGLEGLLDAGAPLPSALRGASLLAGPAALPAADSLARSLESGGGATGDGEPLLDRDGTTFLLQSAAAGTSREAASALAGLHRAGMDRQLADAVARTHALALILAGASILAIAAAFFWTYSHALLG